MKQAIINLLKVKSLISLAITGLVVHLGVIGALPADKVFELALIVVSFYFGVQHEKKDEKKDEENNDDSQRINME